MDLPVDLGCADGCVNRCVLQVFFAAVGASANVPLVIKTAPVLFCYSFIALAGHLLLLLGLGRLAGFSLRDLLLASNANIGGELCWAVVLLRMLWGEDV